MADLLYIDNTGVVELQSLTSTLTGEADTAATVTCTVKDLQGNAVTGQSWPATMAHVSAGTYRAILDDGIGILEYRPYVIEVNATGSGGGVGKWQCQVTATKRLCQ
jgi:hypothetical protein